MNRFKISILCLLIAFAAKAQDNDTSLLRKLGVHTVDKYIFVHAFIDNHDTCLVSHQEFNDDMDLLFEKYDMRCYGFTEVDEYTYRYNKEGLRKMIHDKMDGPESITEYVFNKNKQPVFIKTFFFRTNDSSTTTIKYFNSKYQQPDSSISTMINQDGDTIITQTIGRFNEDSLPVEVMLLDSARELMQHIAYDYQDSLLMTSATTTFGEQSGFMQSFYEYDQFGRLTKTYNTVNQRQEFFYLPNGLLRNIMSYNPKGQLEAEFIFKYGY